VHLHNHFGDSSGSLAMLTAVMADLPFSFTLHGPTIFFEIGRWRLDEKIARASFVVCISHFARSQAMLVSEQRHWDRLKIVHCGVRPERYRRDPGRRPGQRAIFVGRLDAVKGVPLLIEAFAAVREAHPEARLAVVGDGPARAALEAQAAALGIAAATEFLGYRAQDEVADLLAGADLLVLPSFAEGLPVVLMEAMASGLPVIATRVAGVAELVEDGVSGLLVPPGDVESLAAALRRLLADPALGARMGAAGRAQVEAAFDSDAEAGWLVELLAGSLGPGLPPGLRPAQGR
jgi:glycosyltransferase involved in cell wall biosynthesis